MLNGTLPVGTDIDGDALTYALAGAAEHGTVVVNANGSYTYTPNANFNGSDSFSFKANDGSADSEVATVSITVNPVNDAPSDILLAGNTVAENQPNATVGILSTSDADAGDSFSYSLVGVSEFVIVGNELKVGSAGLDFEAGATRSVTVRSTDSAGLTLDRTFTVNVTDVAENPVITSNGGGDSGTAAVAENSTFVTTVTTEADPAPGTTRSFSIVGGADALRFTINASGVLSFAAAPDFEAPTDAGANNVYDVVVQVADGAFTDTQALAVTVTNVAGVTTNGTAGNDTLNGTAEEDRLNGLLGNDTLNGGDGNDTLDGGLGSDSMVGGLGNDTYQVEATGDITSELAGQGRDTVRTTLTSYTLQANVEDLSYTGTSNFTGTGNAENNLITGGAGADNLNGGTGNDTLNGGAGGDLMAGGAGDDTYYVDAAGDLVNELAQIGIDTVLTTLNAYTIGNNVENVTFIGAGNFTGSGNSFINLMIGGAGNDTLNALNGNDRLIGGAGNDTLDGGAGNDVFVFAAGFGQDRINGFDAVAETAGAQDRLEFSGGVSFADLAITAVGVDTLVSWGADSILLAGVNATQVDATDFIFNP